MNSSTSSTDMMRAALSSIHKAMLPGFCILLLGPVAAAAQTERQHGAHVHGEAIGSLALDETRLRLELEIPGINLAGFEHPPREPEEITTIERVVDTLNAGNWLTVDDRGNCRIESINAHTRGFDVGDDHPDHNHDPSHDDSSDVHDHQDAEHSHHAHAEFHLVAHLECANSGRLRWLEVNLFDDFPGNELIVVDVLTETLATRTRLGPTRQRIDLTAP